MWRNGRWVRGEWGRLKVEGRRSVGVGVSLGVCEC